MATNCAVELLVVDPAVDDAATLLAGLRGGIDVLRLAPGGNGLEQIAAALRGRRGLLRLHILSHGEPGALRLAGETVGWHAVESSASALGRISTALAPEAEVLLHGCAVARGMHGRRFLDRLEEALGVLVAAAEGPIGSAASGGG